MFIGCMMDTEKMISDMNRHIPVSRKTLLEHIESGDFSYKTRDGYVCSFDKEEIEFLKITCTEIEKMRLRLPILISTDTSSDGAWKADGITETAVVSKVLEKRSTKEDMIRLYHPELKRLRGILPNAVVVLFVP